jgi:CMP-N,N'-diacetyllegionaminic acid synthase
MLESIKDLLIVIPARGGSKGLPGKNARILGDIPLLGWTAQAIGHSSLSGATCILSTDDEQIAKIGRSVGLEVPFMRPSEIAKDETPSDAVVIHALDWMENKYGNRAKYVMLLQPTSPFRPPEILSQAVKILENSSVDGVIGVKLIYRSLATLFYTDENMNLSAIDKDGEMETQRQNVNTIFTPNGAMYLIRTEKLGSHEQFFPKNLQGIPMDQISSIDIDDPIDWEIAEAIANNKRTWRDKLA